MVSSKVKSQIRQAVLLGIRRNADRIFSRSQQTQEGYVPVDRGTLKKSGVVLNIPHGARIAYRVSYARDVEFGVEEDRPIKGDQTIHVRQYRRKDGSVVRAHDVTYHDKKLIGFKPGKVGEKIFRVVSAVKKRPGQWFLLRATKKEIVHLPEDIGFFLSRLGKVTTSK